MIVKKTIFEIEKLKCKMGFHSWEYRYEALPSLTIHRGCARCGIVEYNLTGYHWTAWGGKWTWEDAKKALILKENYFKYRRRFAKEALEKIKNER